MKTGPWYPKVGGQIKTHQENQKMHPRCNSECRASYEKNLSSGRDPTESEWIRWFPILSANDCVYDALLRKIRPDLTSYGAPLGAPIVPVTDFPPHPLPYVPTSTWDRPSPFLRNMWDSTAPPPEYPWPEKPAYIQRTTLPPSAPGLVRGSHSATEDAVSGEEHD
ncbi:hypothetical protein ARMSODRAFT_1091312 [Armillaria solidipes]|uniref:Uncharacterized protein n=1 Tax=Armillaria solidipes TaxID=1076256 RepID=A0A2H3AKB0_9AGAR|nr:hypothetical protein ARMSODRAFT_1091312 [Armillaria solidipes]